MTKDLGYDSKLVIKTDSSAAKGIGSRRGVGKLRHLHTACLWVQRRLFRREVSIDKILGPSNVADMGTKPLAAADTIKHLTFSGIGFRDGRHSLDLKTAG